MAEIIVTITIPEREYISWDEFQTEGIPGIRRSIKKDLSERLRMDFIEDFEIKVTHEK